MPSDINIETIIVLLSTVTSWTTFKNSIKIMVVKVMDMIMVNESLNSITDKNIMMAA